MLSHISIKPPSKTKEGFPKILDVLNYKIFHVYNYVNDESICLRSVFGLLKLKNLASYSSCVKRF